MMWFGTREGINRYDGYKITSYYPQKGESALPGNVVNSIVGDVSGNIYFVCDGKLVDFDHKSEKFSTLNAENVLSVSKGSNGFWVVTVDNLNQFSPSTKTLSLYCKLKKNILAKNIFETAGGRLLVGVPKDFIYWKGTKI